jgi:hypothetical protein
LGFLRETIQAENQFKLKRKIEKRKEDMEMMKKAQIGWDIYHSTGHFPDSIIESLPCLLHGGLRDIMDYTDSLARKTAEQLETRVMADVVHEDVVAAKNQNIPDYIAEMPRLVHDLEEEGGEMPPDVPDVHMRERNPSPPPVNVVIGRETITIPLSRQSLLHVIQTLISKDVCTQRLFSLSRPLDLTNRATGAEWRSLGPASLARVTYYIKSTRPSFREANLSVTNQDYGGMWTLARKRYMHVALDDAGLPIFFCVQTAGIRVQDCFRNFPGYFAKAILDPVMLGQSYTCRKISTDGDYAYLMWSVRPTDIDFKPP